MNKREAEKLARDIAWQVCMMNEVPQQRDFDLLEAYGWKLERKSIAGMDGIAVTVDGREGDLFIASPRKRNPGRKQHCTAYKLGDALTYEAACDALARNDYRLADETMGRIEAQSLRNDVAEGLERLGDELGWATVAGIMANHEQAPQAASGDLESVRALVATIGAFEVWQKRPGCCVWVKGDTKPHKEELKAFGLKFSPKKQAWYWKPAA